ncbi:GPO family capsid scaffolding protein [Aliivibrio logei]|uniref:Phage capsid protein n=1 Tax=Aliivibrio logei TaxID=688 RepID=A0A1B9NTH6_ALILO|nr:GPO family capsid scaffolding protein [Aliivibrio logei]OCH16995.1 phage capsid protein [Aliivibrio logei]
MFQSEPICILKAGPTIDGRHTDQQVIDDLAETYTPKLYTARINEDHWQWGEKLGSVLSVEKRGDELWAVIKPNSRLLSNVERDQFLHTSCEYIADFAKTGKAYLTGLAMTDDPASLGTTQVHLSSDKNKGQESVSSGATVSLELLSGKEHSDQETRTLLNRFIDLLSGNQPTSLSKKESEEEEAEMSKELEALLTKNTEQNEAVATALSSVVTALEKLSAGSAEATPPVDAAVVLPVDAATVPDVNVELSAKVEALSAQMTEFTTKLSAMTDEDQRTLAGSGGETPYL